MVVDFAMVLFRPLVCVVPPFRNKSCDTIHDSKIKFLAKCVKLITITTKKKSCC